MTQPLRVTVWHEYRHEHKNKTVGELYPDGMHMVMKSAIEENIGVPVEVTTLTLDQDENHGITDELLENTDVMTWWGHAAHGDVKDEIAQKVAERVRQGMGLVVLHSGHYAKPFKLLMGTNCHLTWREAAEKERLWCVSPGHPITAGLGLKPEAAFFEIEHTEMYGEHFDIPDPDELVFVSWFEGGEIFRSGCVWKRGAGKVFYFRPGHETFPIYYHEKVRKVLANGVKYVAPAGEVLPYRVDSPNIKEPLETIKSTHEVDESLH